MKNTFVIKLTSVSRKEKTAGILSVTPRMGMLFKLTLVIVGQPGRQCAVAPPVLGGGTVAWWEGRAEKSALQVLLEQLAGDAGLACRDQVQVRRVAVLLHAVGGQ